MHPTICKLSPLRDPRWRAKRVMELVEHLPSPRYPRFFEDDYVRVYRNFLVAFLAAGNNEVAQFTASHERPHAHHAHLLHYDSDRQLRDVLEARLLTNESFAEIANRIGTEPKTIEFYEALFFNVRDRLSHKDWIEKVIRDPSGELSQNRRHVTPEDQRGYVYRWFAFHGGPLVLDAMYSGMSAAEMPERVEDVADWFADSLGRTLRTRVAEMALLLKTDNQNALSLIKKALCAKHANAAARTRTKSEQAKQDEEIKNIREAVDKFFTPPTIPPADETDRPTPNTPK